MSFNIDKVVIISGQSKGGMAHYTENLLQGLASFVNAEAIYIESVNERECNINSKLNRIILKITEKYNPFYYKGVAKKIIYSHKPAVIHFTCLFTGAAEMIRYFKKNNIAVFCTIHDPVPHQENKSLWSKIYTWYFRTFIIPRILRLANGIHVHSKIHLALLEQNFRHLVKSFYVVQHGGGLPKEIANGTSIPSEMKDILIDKDNTALFFGRIEPYKGLNILIESMKVIIKSFPEFKLLIAGSGELPLIPDSLKKNLIVINRFINDDEIKYIFESSSFLVLPYLSATQTGVIPIASSFRIPTIVSNVGALPELMDNNITGFVVESGNYLQLAEKMIWMISNPYAKTNMGKNSYEFMIRNFSWEAIAENHMNSYKKLS
jgi:starch synthase